uniref:Caspase recruitment domain family, member 14 n=1 Tax=Astyanax mexicanus TaxID=7994 RepID=A0A8B9J4M3_ASTMX
MAGDSVEETPDLKDMDEEELWDLINDNRHAISLGVRPCVLIPYLRQVRVLTDLDEDEILTCLKFNNRSMRTSHMLDILRMQGRNGAVALLDSLMIHYPNLYTQVTGRKPSTEPSGFSGLIKYSELTEYLVRAVTGMQKELQEAREEAAQLRSRCCGLQGELSQAVTQGQDNTRLHAENARLRTHLAGKKTQTQASAHWLIRNHIHIQCISCFPANCFRNFFFFRVSEAPAPPFLVRSRHQALRVTDRALSFSFQGEALLSQLQVIGGNKTGVFVHQVTEGSSAHISGISPGAQILEVQSMCHAKPLRMVLEDSTMEEALWALGQVQGPCTLSLRPKRDAYENLLQQLKKGDVTSGDSFYVRVNMSLTGSAAGALAVTCNDILHVTDTHHGHDGSWWASVSTNILTRIVHFVCSQAQGKQKAVRIVSTGRQGRNPLWVSVEEDNESQTKSNSDGSTPRSCVTLMPYTLVTPHYPPVCRPVLLLPTWQERYVNLMEFHTCDQIFFPVKSNVTYNLPNITIQKNKVISLNTLNIYFCVFLCVCLCVKGTHCVLPLGLDCVRRLHRAEIFPIIIFVASTERSTRRLKQKLRHNFVTEAQLLECSRSEEPLLDKLPCLYRTVPPESWSDSATLLDTLQYVVGDEQSKIVWVEPNLW